MKDKQAMAGKDAAPRRDGRRDNAHATRAALCAAGHALFGALGYEGSSVGALCAQAGVTAGALYHHYGDKKGLFAAVAEQMDAALAERAASASAAALARGATPWESMLAAVDTMLASGADPALRRIGLSDAPAVLGADAWLAIRERHGLGAMRAAVQGLQAAGLLIEGDATRLARIVLGMLYGAVEALPDRAPPAKALAGVVPRDVPPSDARHAARALDETRRITHAMLAALRR
ncbi:MAG: TetR/AcrR family transcriptional regulator [Pseudomonadota bacterium]